MIFIPFAYAAEVKNVTAKQVGNRMLFEYDLVGDEPDAEVNVTIMIKGQSYPMEKLHLEGDFGKVKTGRGKKIWWNVLQDYPRGVSGDVEWEVVAGAKMFKDPVTGMEFVFVKGGCFEMGDTFGDGNQDERPLHKVCVDDFYLGKYEVRVGDFRKFVNETGYRTEAESGDGCYTYKGDKWGKDRNANWRNPGFVIDDRHPVVCVSWNDSMAFIDWLKRKTGKQYRLPREAEWEYAGRNGGRQHKYSWGNGDPAGNIADESGKRRFFGWTIWNGYDDGYIFTAPVGSFRPNDLGLYDMTGNVWEWCSDWYGESYYQGSPRNNPEGPGHGSYKVIRGGSWNVSPGDVRAANRDWFGPADRGYSLGFRLGASAR
jgi:formylglycine-generating enzyme required for sulfatase activity